MADNREYLWSLVKGDDETRVFTYQDALGDAIDLTGYTSTIEIANGADAYSIAGVIDGPNGTVTINVPNATTALFKGVCSFRVKIVAPITFKVRTLVYGDMRLLK